MASFPVLASLLLALFVTCQADLIGDICPKTVNPSLCSDSLRSDPRSKGANLQTLALIAADESISATAATVKVASSLESGAIKQKAESCVKYCNQAVGVLNQVRNSLSGGGAGNLRTEVGAAFTNIAFCDSQFGRRRRRRLS